jgi:hypothetical protein
MVCLAFCIKPWKISCFLSHFGAFLPSVIKRLWDYFAHKIRRPWLNKRSRRVWRHDQRLVSSHYVGSWLLCAV